MNWILPQLWFTTFNFWTIIADLPRLWPFWSRKTVQSSILPKGANIIFTSFSLNFFDNIPINNFLSSANNTKKIFEVTHSLKVSLFHMHAEKAQVSWLSAIFQSSWNKLWHTPMGWPLWLSWMRIRLWSGGCGFKPCRVGNILFGDRSWNNYFLRSLSLFCWFKKGSCQFLVKECAQYWLIA